METILAIYGAVLATLIAVAQAIASLRRRARVDLSASFRFSTLDEVDKDRAHGTPVRTNEGDLTTWREALLCLTVRNRGGAPIQIVAVVLESLKPDGTLKISQYSPSPLPHILEPGTRIEMSLQKEPLDMLDNVTFFGVVDALGRRFMPEKTEARSVVMQSWELPTRVRKYSLRNDPLAPPVLAYQNRENAALIDTSKAKGRATSFVSRSAILP